MSQRPKRSKRQGSAPSGDTGPEARQRTGASDGHGVARDTPGAGETTEVPATSPPLAEGAVPAEAGRIMEATPAPVVLPACLDASAVRAVYDDLRRALAREGELHVDGRQVTKVDTAGGQLLAAAALTGRHLHLQTSTVLEEFLNATALTVVLS
jgi:hypothetical protein